MSARRLRLALPQTRMHPSPSVNMEAAEAAMARAAEAGANLVCLPELFRTPYFCQTQDPRHFDLAESVPGPSTERLAKAARRHGVVVIAPLFERAAAGLYFNTAAVIEADGRYLGKYRKMHIPQDPGFEEKFYFTPGDLGFRAWSTSVGVIGVLICWDQWYPEAARLTALQGAELLLCPTAIGWLAEERASLGAAQHEAWETVQRGHAVANGCYLAAVNRVGVEGRLEFWGQSFVADPYGQIVARASSRDEELLIHDCHLEAVEEFRRIWPFFRDRRVDAYANLQNRWTNPAGNPQMDS